MLRAYLDRVNIHDPNSPHIETQISPDKSGEFSPLKG